MVNLQSIPKEKMLNNASSEVNRIETKFNKEYNELRAKAIETKNDNLLLTEGKVIQENLKAFNQQMKEHMKEGIFYEFLQKMYPSDK